MPLFRVHIIGEYSDGVPNNNMSMSWGVEAAATPSAQAVWDAFVAVGAIPSATTSWRGIIGSTWKARYAEVRGAAGGPVLDFYEGTPLGGSVASAWAGQIAIPVSMLVGTGSLPARRGRLMLGPVQQNAGAIRPGVGILGYVLNFCQNWHAQLVGLGYQPRFLSNAGTVGVPVVGYSVGNAYATVKSRKSEVTARTDRLI